MDNLILGLQLMVVGMVTVFAILLIVINGSKLLITIVNQVVDIAEEAPRKKMAVMQNAAILTPNTTTTIDAQTMEILQQAVTQITHGKGRISAAVKM